MLLGQTRAVVPAVAVSALLLLVAVPGRTRRAWALVVAGAGVAACIGPVLDVYDSVRGARPPADAQLRDAAARDPACLRSQRAPSGRAAVAVVGRLGDADGRGCAAARMGAACGWPWPSSLAWRARRGRRPGRQGARRVPRLRRARTPEPTSSSRFTSGAGNRYDYWRVAVDQFADDPLRGDRRRQLRPHLLPRAPHHRGHPPGRTASSSRRSASSGIVGGAPAGGLPRRHRQPASPGARAQPGAILRVRGLAVAAGGTFAVWLVHTSVDWLHLIPGLTGIALCSAAVLVGPWTRPRAGTREHGQDRCCGRVRRGGARWARSSWAAPPSRTAT